jgi:hypothetical protein
MNPARAITAQVSMFITVNGKLPVLCFPTKESVKPAWKRQNIGSHQPSARFPAS